MSGIDMRNEELAMMRYRIINDTTGASFTVEGSTVDECRQKAEAECEVRGWSGFDEVRAEGVAEVEEIK